MSPSDASRPLSQPRLGILTPASDGSVNRKHPRESASARESLNGGPGGSSARTKPAPTRPGRPMEELLKPSIVVKPHPPTILVKPVALQPLMLLPRESLPLAHIDLSDSHVELPASRFFESRIRIMELEGRLGSNVLIVRSESSRIVYAIERHANGHYVVCKLGSWVNVAELALDSTVCCVERIRPSEPPAAAPTCFEPPLLTPQVYKESKRKRQAIEDLQSLCRKRQRSQSVANLATHPKQQEQQQQQQAAAQCHLPTPVDDMRHDDQTVAKPTAEQQPELAPSHEVSQLPVPEQQLPEPALDAPQTARDIFNHVRAQYFEALYHSMGSLAYFAKGPLSRARAAFHLNCDGNLEMTDLIGFLKNLVMTTIMIDKKYLATIPEVIEQMKLAVESSDEGGQHRPPRKPPKKMRIGKDGLYPTEAEHVKRWWNRTRPELRDGETSVSPQQVRYHISCLRRRETLLQLILILEILSLEAARPPEDPADVQLPGLEAATEVTAKPAHADGPKKKRSRHNYPVLLDVHADRLCIWESTTLDDVRALAESQSRTGEGHKSDKPLVDFCIDVILPFFSARLPELCDSLNRKLGGPFLQSPPKQRREKTVATAARQRGKPGAPAKRPPAKPESSSKSARSLERVLSNDKLRRSVSRGPSDALAHLRHATVAHVPGLKREASETKSLKDPPAADAGPLHDRAPSLLHSRSVSFTTVEDARAKKKAMVQAELQEAILALKKPNRVLAGKVMVEETERRLFAGPTYVTKTKRPVQSPKNKVQVKATPANNRFRDALADDPRHGSGFNLSRAHQTLKPTGMAARVDEAALPGASGSSCVASTPLVNKTQHASARAAGRGDAAGSLGRGSEVVPPSSPIQGRKAAARPQSTQWEEAASSGALLFPPGQANLIPASSPRRPVDEAHDPLSATPRRGGRAMLRAQTLVGSLTETPVKPRSRPAPLESAVAAVSSGVVATATPSAKAMTARTEGASISISPPPKATAKTIYQQLGWDDDYPDELS